MLCAMLPYGACEGTTVSSMKHADTVVAVLASGSG